MVKIGNTTIINMTPHTVNILKTDGTELAIEASGYKIRLQEMTTEECVMEGIRLTHSDYGKPVLVCPDGSEDELPAEREGTFYIVSQLCQDALPKRYDLFIPNELVRDEAGRIVGCRSLGVQV